jgi:hypothetical protein
MADNTAPYKSPSEYQKNKSVYAWSRAGWQVSACLRHIIKGNLKATQEQTLRGNIIIAVFFDLGTRRGWMIIATPWPMDPWK